MDKAYLLQQPCVMAVHGRRVPRIPVYREKREPEAVAGGCLCLDKMNLFLERPYRAHVIVTCFAGACLGPGTKVLRPCIKLAIFC